MIILYILHRTVFIKIICFNLKKEILNYLSYLFPLGMLGAFSRSNANEGIILVKPSVLCARKEGQIPFAVLPSKSVISY